MAELSDVLMMKALEDEFGGLFRAPALLFLVLSID